MKYHVTSYRTLEAEREIEAETLDEARERAANIVSRMSNDAFSVINEEVAEIIDPDAAAPVTVVVI